jgi:hypothetical protein
MAKFKLFTSVVVLTMNPWLDSQQVNQQEWQLEWHLDETAARAVCDVLL